MENTAYTGLQCAALPHGERCRIPFASINDEFFEEERYEAFAALSAVLKLKERVQTLSGREQQLEIDLKEAIAKEEQTRAESATNQLQHQKDVGFLQGGIRDLSEVLQRKDEMIRALKEQMMEIELQLQRSKAEIDRQGSKLEQMQQTLTILTLQGKDFTTALPLWCTSAVCGQCLQYFFQCVRQPLWRLFKTFLAGFALLS